MSCKSILSLDSHDISMTTCDPMTTQESSVLTIASDKVEWFQSSFSTCNESTCKDMTLQHQLDSNILEQHQHFNITKDLPTINELVIIDKDNDISSIAHKTRGALC